MIKKTFYLFIYFFSITYLLFSQSNLDTVKASSAYHQLYSIKYTILGMSASAEFSLNKKGLVLNIEPSISIFPILTAVSGKTISGADIFFANTPNAKITIEPKFYFLNNKRQTDNNSFNSISLAVTYHFKENYSSKNNPTYTGLSLIPKYTLKSNISKRTSFQTGLGYGIAFVSASNSGTAVKGIFGLDVKFAFILFKK